MTLENIYFFLPLRVHRTFLTRSAEQGAVLSRPSVTLDCYRLTHQKCYRCHIGSMKKTNTLFVHEINNNTSMFYLSILVLLFFGKDIPEKIAREEKTNNKEGDEEKWELHQRDNKNTDTPQYTQPEQRALFSETSRE